MTPEQFAAAYRSTANLVSAGTGIDPVALLSQWANETAWGTVVVGNNLGNIRCSPTTFCKYATLQDFAQACIATFHNGNYNAVLAAGNAVSQLAAIVASPWSSGHYGGSLMAYYAQVEAYEMTPDEYAVLVETRDKGNEVWDLLRTGIHAPQNPRWIFTELEGLRTQLNGLEAGNTTILQAIADLKASIKPGGAALTPAQAQQLTHIETMLTTGLKGT